MALISKLFYDCQIGLLEQSTVTGHWILELWHSRLICPILLDITQHHKISQEYVPDRALKIHGSHCFDTTTQELLPTELFKFTENKQRLGEFILLNPRVSDPPVRTRAEQASGLAAQYLIQTGPAAECPAVTSTSPFCTMMLKEKKRFLSAGESCQNLMLSENERQVQGPWTPQHCQVETALESDGGVLAP